jgi:hypothetical protein
MENRVLGLVTVTVYNLSELSGICAVRFNGKSLLVFSANISVIFVRSVCYS